ncbi:type II secretion system protein [Planctomycetota bacterium]
MRLNVLTPRRPTPPRHRRARRAFTLIELLVVITVIAILAGMLLPAIKAARESTRKRVTKQLVVQIGMAVAQYADSYGVEPPERTPGTRLYSSECLTAFLGRGLIPYRAPGGSELSLPDAQKDAIRSKRDFLTLKKSLIFDSNENGFPEVVDAWGLPILYNRTQFTTGVGPLNWSMGNGASSGGRPLHNPKGFDIFSGNTYGRIILGDPAKVGLNNYENDALEKRGSYSTEHHFRYPYLNEFLKHRRKTGNKENVYIGNW